jgi:hypothetical protein
MTRFIILNGVSRVLYDPTRVLSLVLYLSIGGGIALMHRGGVLRSP